MLNPSKLQALVDMFEIYGSDIMYNCSEFAELSCEEQMVVESHIA